MKLSIIIPAYNEEQAIASIIEKSLSARRNIIKKSGIKDVEVIVVNDGSMDRTEQIARGYKEIKLVSYKKNKGYGGAIKQGFKNATGDLLSFLDADGTCDPLLFVDLVNSLLKNNADIAIGLRLGPGSKMPKIRRMGNIIYAKMINFFGDAQITDCSSGMRVLKKEALEKLYPLPDGLHFTPAMTCKAVMGKGLKIVEVPIEYAERTGKSKLSIIKDGMRFLKTILANAALYKPVKFFATIIFVIWVALWIMFLARENFIKNNVKDYKILMSRTLEGKRAYVTGDRFYEFLLFCNEKLPDGAEYEWVKADKQDHTRRRSTYYLYPHLEKEGAQFLLVYDDHNAAGEGWEMFARLDDSRYILKKKRTADWK